MPGVKTSGVELAAACAPLGTVTVAVAVGWLVEHYAVVVVGPAFNHVGAAARFYRTRTPTVSSSWLVTRTSAGLLVA